VLILNVLLLRIVAPVSLMLLLAMSAQSAIRLPVCPGFAQNV
jgi:hypothetical protein